MKKIIETPRLILRNFQENDLEDFIELTTNKKVCEMCNWPHFTDRETLKYSLLSQTSKPLNFAIVLKEENKVVGAVELLNYKNEQTAKEIAFMLNEKYWNKGIMTEAIDVVANYAFNHLNITTLIGGYFENNISRLTKNDRKEIAKRAARGEKISF